MKNYYAILEVPVGCSLEEIRQAYRRLVQENLDNPAVFAEMREAYEVLTTPARRLEYDQAAWGETFPAGAGFKAASSGEAETVHAGRCPMGIEAQCPILQTHFASTDHYCPECGYALAALNGSGVFDLSPQSDTAHQTKLEEAGGQTHGLRIGINMVGRENADVLLVDKTVSRQHARLEMTPDGVVTVEDLSSTNGTQVNAEMLVPHIPRRLAAGDQVRFGSVLTQISLPVPDDGVSRVSSDAEKTASEKAHSPARAQVVEMREENPRTYPLAPGITTFGRRPENNVVLLDDPYVSGNHAQIIAEDDVFRLIDVGSTNGTLLNGERIGINEPMALSPGNVILIGGSALRFEPISSAGENEAAAVPESQINPELQPEAAVSEATIEPPERTAQEYDTPVQETLPQNISPQDNPPQDSPPQDALTQEARGADALTHAEG